MGDINCHCNPETNKVVMPEIQVSQNPLSRPSCKDPNQKKVRSRINSIVSPRQLIQHSKSNSCALANDASTKSVNFNQENRLQISCDGNNMLDVIIGKLSKSIVALYQDQRTETQCQQYDFNLKAISQYQAFGLVTKSTNNNKLVIKDKGIGLGVFKWFSQGSEFLINKDNQQTEHPIILDIGIGHFAIIVASIDEKFRKKHKSIKCFTISKNSNGWHHKISRSLPMLYGNSCMPKQQNVIQISEGQSKTIDGKIIVRVSNQRMHVKSIHYQGFYKYMSQFEQISNNDILRLGAKLFTVSLEQRNQNIFKISKKF